MGAPKMPTLTGWFIIVTAMVWLGFEVYVIIYKKQTISNAMYDFATKMPMVPFIIGLLMGHWFWVLCIVITGASEWNTHIKNIVF